MRNTNEGAVKLLEAQPLGHPVWIPATAFKSWLCWDGWNAVSQGLLLGLCCPLFEGLWLYAGLHTSPFVPEARRSHMVAD